MIESDHLEFNDRVENEEIKEDIPESGIDVSKEDFPQKESTSKFTINSSITTGSNYDPANEERVCCNKDTLLLLLQYRFSSCGKRTCANRSHCTGEEHLLEGKTLGGGIGEGGD